VVFTIIQGYDSCRTEYTTASEHMEWVLRDPDQIVKILHIEKISLQNIDANAPAAEMLTQV